MALAGIGFEDQERGSEEATVILIGNRMRDRVHLRASVFIGNRMRDRVHLRASVFSLNII